MTTPDDKAPLSSEEMIRRAREELATPPDEMLPASAPVESPRATQRPAPPQKPARRLTRIAPTPGARATQANSTRVLVAIFVVLALIGVVVAIMVASISTTAP